MKNEAVKGEDIGIYGFAVLAIISYENRMLKNEKSANRNEHQNRKVFWHKKRKTDPKNSQNRKTINPNVLLL